MMTRPHRRIIEYVFNGDRLIAIEEPDGTVTPVVYSKAAPAIKHAALESRRRHKKIVATPLHGCYVLKVLP